MISNNSLHCLICESCGYSVFPEEVQSHLRTSHPSAGFKVNGVQLQQAVEDLDIVPHLPELDGGEAFDEFAGLTLHKGIFCNECPKIMGTPGSAKVHYSIAHRGVVKPKHLPTGYYQQLRKGLGLFRVNPRSRSTISSDEKLVEEIRAETDKAFMEVMGASCLNARGVTPWLLSTKWHLHVDGHDPAELIALVKPLTKHEDYKLVILVHQYFQHATDLIDHMDELTLQHLNSPDPTKLYV